MKVITRRYRKIWLIPIILLAIGISFGVIIFIRYSSAHSPTVPKTTAIKKTTSAPAPTTVKPSFDKTKYSTTSSSSLWVIANKQHPLSPLDYAPSDLVTTSGITVSNKAIIDLEAMVANAKADGVNLTAASGYRSYGTQKTLYNNYVSNNGQTATDTFSARPGYSEHQTGLAIDFNSGTNPNCNFDTCFETTTEGQWLAVHASEYGFLLRYTTEKQQITGYKSESWHYRYIGRELMTEMKKHSILTLEEFFNIGGGETYL